MLAAALFLGLLTPFGTARPQVAHGPAPSGCSKFEIIVARGTSEPGPFGSIVGDPLVRAVTRGVPGSRGYAVQYPATTQLKASAGVGIDDVINRLNKQVKQCPEQRFALVGYSQGAGVIHGIFQYENRTYPGAKGVRPVLEKDSVLSKIASLATFGDPSFGYADSTTRGALVFPMPTELRPRWINNCAHNDPNCDPTPGGSFSNHLKYSRDPWQKESVAFIIASFNGKPLENPLNSMSDPRWKKYP